MSTQLSCKNWGYTPKQFPTLLYVLWPIWTPFYLLPLTSNRPQFLSRKFRMCFISRSEISGSDIIAVQVLHSEDSCQMSSFIVRSSAIPSRSHGSMVIAPFMVTFFGTSLKPIFFVCDFLLLNNTNVLISHWLRDIDDWFGAFCRIMITVLPCRYRIFDHFCSCDLDLDLMTFI